MHSSTGFSTNVKSLNSPGPATGWKTDKQYLKKKLNKDNRGRIPPINKPGNQLCEKTAICMLHITGNLADAGGIASRG